MLKLKILFKSYVKFCSIFVFIWCQSSIFGIKGEASFNRESYEILNENNHNKCNEFDRSEIGLIYVYLSNRVNQIIGSKPQLPNSGTIFRLNNYYSLLLYAKLFKPTKHDRMLFYYINDSGRPVSNHYNRWLEDPEWAAKIPLNSIKFIKFNSTDEKASKLNYTNIILQISNISSNYFDRPKKYYMLITSDIILGPRILSCFSRDSAKVNPTRNLNGFGINLDSIRLNVHNDCYKSLHSAKSNGYYSFMYKLDMLHDSNDLSGILLWKSDVQPFTKIDRSIVDPANVYKCHYKNDVSKNSYLPFEDTYCIFGYELNVYEAPVLQDIFNDDQSYFFRLARQYLYGYTHVIKYSKNEIAKIPNIVHLIWFSDNNRGLKFIEYLCLKSILLVLKPDKVRIHGDRKPRCNLWNEISMNSKIEWVQTERPVFKYDQDFTNSPIQHLADVARLEVLYNEGGIYSDFDILWVKPVDELRRIDADIIASNDITSYCDEFPNSIQIGAFLAKPKSEFILKWLEGYREKYHLYPGDYVAVSMCEPYKLYEKDPTKVFVENRLQMIYFNGWSAFIPKYTEIDQEKLQDFNDKLDWLRDGTYGYHLPRHGDLHSKSDYEKAQNKSTLPMKIAKFIFNLSLN